MKIVIFIVLLAILLSGVFRSCSLSYEYEREIGSYWSLADKASTIEQKSVYVDKFIAALDDSGRMHGHNALIFPTPDNDVELNMEALRSLQTRLHQSKDMDPRDTSYQMAIQQITAQEQGEAEAVLSNVEGVWLLNGGHVWCWEWVGTVVLVFMLACLGAMVVLITSEWEWWNPK